MRRSMLFVALVAVPLVVAQGKPSAASLSSKLRAVVDTVEAACLGGNAEEVWRALSPTVNRLSGEAGANFGAALQAKNLPPARELLVEARLKLLMEGREGALPAPSLRERLLIVETMNGRIQEALRQIADESSENKAPVPPKTMDEFDRRCCAISDLRTKLRSAEVFARYGTELAHKLPAEGRKKLTESERDTISQAEGDVAAKLQDAVRDVWELELELRLWRLRYGIEVLRQKQLTKEKFLAAALTRQDARVLREAIEPPPATVPVVRKGTKGKVASAQAAAATAAPNPSAPSVFHRASLTSTDPELAKEVAKLAHQAAELAGSLGERAERFFAGLEFWLRGRYGWGPDVGGLAKSSAVLDQPALLGLLYMPENLLTPAEVAEKKDQPPAVDAGKRVETASSKSASSARNEKQKGKPRQAVQCPDRRHHYTWAWEDRRLATSMSPQLIRDINGVETVNHLMAGHWGPHGSGGYLPFGRGVIGGIAFDGTNSHGTFDFRTRETNTNVSVPPQDPRLVYRIVGFLEYAKSFEFLDKFVAEASVVELEVGEEIIRSQDAFRLTTNLSRRLEQMNPLSENSGNPRDDFNRHGLEWMLALARVEVGAMLAAFTSHSDPFLSLAPKTVRTDKERVTRPFGIDAFGKLLMDGLRTHYWSIVREDVIDNYFKTGVPENHLLTYGRRAILGQQFVRAVQKFGGAANDGGKLQPDQQAELQKCDQTFQKVQRMVLYCLTTKLGRTKVQDNLFSEVFNHHSRWITTERDQTPEMIRRLMVLADPTLSACGCR